MHSTNRDIVTHHLENYLFNLRISKTTLQTLDQSWLKYFFFGGRDQLGAIYKLSDSFVLRSTALENLTEISGVPRFEPVRNANAATGPLPPTLHFQTILVSLWLNSFVGFGVFAEINRN